MLGKFVILLLLFTGSFGNFQDDIFEKVRTHCIFSKYIRGLFMLNEKYFSLMFLQNGKETYTSKDLMAYGDNLQSHGDVIMAMLDKLRSEQPDIFHVDLMTANLYINNTYGHLYLHSSTTAADILDVFMDVNAAMRIKYLEYYGMVRHYLLEFLNGNCRKTWITMSKASESLETVKSLTVGKKCVDNVKDPQELLSKIDQLKTAASNVILSDTFKKKDYTDFKPANMILSSLLSGYETQSWIGKEKMKLSTVTATNIKKDDGLNLMRLVKINKQYANKDGYNIMDLYICAEFNFKADLVKSFQQQVLAATIHPVFSCASRYFTTIEYVYTECKSDLNFDRIEKIGTTLIVALNEIKNFNIFSIKVDKYLTYLVKKTTEIVNLEKKNNFIPKNPHWIKELLNLCSNPMELNGLVFDANAKIVQNKEECGAVINQTEKQIDELKIYLNALSNNLDVYHIIKRTVPHDKMFEEKPLNVLEYCADDVWSFDANAEASTNKPDLRAGNTNKEKSIHENEGQGSGNEATSGKARIIEEHVDKTKDYPKKLQDEGVEDDDTNSEPEGFSKLEKADDEFIEKEFFQTYNM
ncbi:uncharacterized protein LOC126838494 [Adelges cooleyi]|uniref:uncharacterized protein LOC126838494 n=1 Tax=Adelges cooleyi TaxID=133065 RepID=UPI002180029A|nr:uncharacterized protein LOC126838494 [Adelges cooleyi]